MNDKTVYKAIGELLKEQREFTDEQINNLEKRIQEKFADDIFEIQNLAKVPGKDGQDGKDASPEEIVEKLLQDDSFLASIKGQDGKDVAPEELLELAKSDDEFLEQIKGVDGKDGQEGRDGVDGAPGIDGMGIETKAWQEGQVYRQGDYVTANFGQTFRAINDTVKGVDSEDWARIGNGGFRFTGPINKDFNYEDGDLLVKDFGLFLQVKGEKKLIAGRGPKGERGEKGVSGIDGQDGRNGTVIEEVDLVDGDLIFLQRDESGDLERKTVSLKPFMEMVTHIAGDELAKELKGFDGLVKNLVDDLILHHKDEGATPTRFFRGLWTPTGRYNVGDIVSYGYAMYIAKKDSQGVIPEGGITLDRNSGEYWRLVISAIIPEILAKPRADHLYALTKWNDRDLWEQNSVVRLGGRIYKNETKSLDGHDIGPNPNSAPLSIEVTSLGDGFAPKLLEVHGGPAMDDGNLGLTFDFSLGGAYNLAMRIHAGDTAETVATNLLNQYAQGFSQASRVDAQTIMIAPGPADKGPDLTFIPQTRMPADAGTPVKIKVSGGPVNNTGTLDFALRDGKSGDDVQTISLQRGMDTEAVIDAIVADWSSPTTTATKDSAFGFTITPNSTSGDVQEFRANPSSLAAINLANSSSAVELKSVVEFGVKDYNVEPSLWTDVTPKVRMGELSDASELIKASNGQVPMWNAANHRWEPKDIVAPITYLGTKPWDGGDVLDKSNFYGMDQDTVPDPTVWHPRPGDTYIALATGQVTILQGPGGTVDSDAAPIQRHANMITTGTSPASLDAIRNNLGELDDVDLRSFRPADGDVLSYDAGNDVWKPVGAGGGTKYDQILFQGAAPYDASKKNDGITYGMPAGTVPSPASNPPKAGDIYVNATDHIQTHFITGHSDDVNHQNLLNEVRKHLGTYQGWHGDTGHGGQQMYVNAYMQSGEIDINQSVKPAKTRFIIDIEGGGSWTDHSHATQTTITLSVSDTQNRVPAKYLNAAIDIVWPGGAGKTVSDYAAFVKSAIESDPVWSTLFTVTTGGKYLWLDTVDNTDLVNEGNATSPTMYVTAPWSDNQGSLAFAPQRRGVDDYLAGEVTGNIVAIDGTTVPMNITESLGRAVIDVPNSVPGDSRFELMMHGTKYVIQAQRDIQVEQENWDRGSEGGVMQLDHSDNVWKVEKMPYYTEQTWMDARNIIPGEGGLLNFTLDDGRRPVTDFIEMNGFVKPTKAGAHLNLSLDVEIDVGGGSMVTIDALETQGSGSSWAQVVTSGSVTGFSASQDSGVGENSHHGNFGNCMHKTILNFKPKVALPFNVQVRAYKMESQFWTIQWSAMYTSENNTPMTISGYMEVDFSGALSNGLPTTLKSIGIHSHDGSKLDGRLTANWH